MNTLTNKDKLALQVSLALVAGMFSLLPVVQGAPIRDKVVRGEVNIDQDTTANVTAITSESKNNVINWKDFSVGSAEKVVFDAGSKEGSTSYTKSGVEYRKDNNYLNVVTGNGTSYVDGGIYGGNNVYLVNPNGVIMGKNADIDVGSLYVSTKKLTNLDELTNDGTGAKDLSGSGILTGTVNAEVVNMGKIQANSVYVEGTGIRFLNTADVTSDGKNALHGVEMNAPADEDGIVNIHIGYKGINNGSYSTPVSSNAASNLGYKINGNTYAFDNGENPYDYALVSSASDLRNVDNLTINYMLEKSIDLESQNYNPIGSDENHPFKGKFDGNFFEVSNIRIKSSQNKIYGGLFGYTQDAEIKNVGVVDPFMFVGSGSAADGYGGSIVGFADNTVLKNVYSIQSDATKAQAGIWPRLRKVEGLDKYDGAGLGGLVGAATNGTVIKNAYNTVNVISGAGLVGKLSNSSIINAYNAGVVVKHYYSDINTNNSEVYGIYESLFDGDGDASTIENVYNIGPSVEFSGGSTINIPSSATVASLGPDKTIITNGYTVSKETNEGSTGWKVTYAGKDGGNGAYDDAIDDGLNAKAYGFFNVKGTLKTHTGDWRIYDGHSLPLLRSFLKNKPTGPVGTVPVGYKLSLYANKKDSTPVMKMKGSSANGKVTYNGYWMGIDEGDIVMDTTRGLVSDNVQTSTSGKIKNVADDPVTFFYCTGQDGYDLATESLQVEARPIVKPGSIKITDVDKVYDGTPGAEAALSDRLTTKIDLRDYADDNGLIEKDPGYGVVEVYDSLTATTPVYTDDVTLDTTNVTASYNNVNATVQTVGNPNKINNAVITLDKGNVYALKGTQTGTTDYNNYSISASDLSGVEITGAITLRPVQVGLHETAIGSKTYDSSDQVIYVNNSEGSNWTANEGTTITAKDNVYQNLAANTGLVVKTVKKANGDPVDDGVKLDVTAPYYTPHYTAEYKGNTYTVSDAGTGYIANYDFKLTGPEDKLSNYKLMNVDGKAELSPVTAGSDVYRLTAKGNIDKRKISVGDISILNSADKVVDGKDPDGNTVVATKDYNHSKNFEAAAKASFNVTDVVRRDVAMAHAEEADEKGVIDVDKDALLANPLGLSSATFADANVGEKKDITYQLTTSTGGAWKNYELEKSTVTRKGNITHRTIKVAMRNGDGIDKDYGAVKTDFDASTASDTELEKAMSEVVGTDANGYLGFYDTKATGKNDNGYVKYADDASYYKLVADDDDLDDTDDVRWSITGVYKQTAGEADWDVNWDANAKEEKNKNIIYTIGLEGDDASNYKLIADGMAKAGDTAILNAQGKIKQLEITPDFSKVTKQYDGTTYVFPSEEEVTFSDGTKGILTPKDENGNAITKDSINITLPGLVRLDEDKVTIDKNSLTAEFNSPNVSDANTVNYGGLKLATTDADSTKVNNYKLATVLSDEGEIKPLALTESNLSPTYNNVSKTYDGEAALANAKNYVTSMGVSGVVSTAVGTLPTMYESATTAIYDRKNRGGEDNHDVAFTFKISDGSGNYTFATSENLIANTGVDAGTYTFKDSTTGKLLAKDVIVTVNDNLTKTYDAMEEYTDGNRNPQSGDNVLKLEGLLGNDKNKNVSTAKYNDANASATSGDKTVYYKPVLNAEDNTNYRLVNDEGNTVDENGKIYDTDGNEIGSLTGSGTINKRPLTLKFADLSKKYDGTADLTGENVAAIAVTLDDGLNGAVIGADGTSVNKANLDTDYSYGVLDNTGFSSNANAGAANAVRYNGIDADVLGDKIGNYSLYYKYGDSDAAAIVNGTGYGLGSIGKKKLAYTDFAATFNDVTKVYDATDAVKADGGVNTLVNSFTINGETVDYATSGNSGYSIASANYGTMDNSGTFTPNVNAGTQSAGTQNAVFKFTIGSDWEDNYDFSDLANSPYFDSATRTVAINTAADNGNATITAKTIYAALLDSNHYVSPNKVYDGTKTVKTAAGQPVGNDLTSSGTSARFGDYLTISGLEGSDANIVKVNAAYNDANVAQTVAGLGNAVNYTVNLGSVAGNYDLQGVDDDNKLQGAGVITPKDVYLNVTEATKNYDGHSDVKMTAGNGVSNVPTFTIEGTVNGENGPESITYTASEDTSKNITGTYLDANLDPDANVALEGNNVVHKAVRYGNVVLDNMTAVNTALSNYRLASGGGGTYDADNHTVTFDKTTAKGKIEKLQVNNIVAAYNDPEVKVYDGTTSLTYNHTAYDATNNPEGFFDDQVKEVTSIGSVKGVQINADGYSVVLDSADDYSVRGSYENADEGPGKKVNYEFTVDKTVFNNLIYSQYNGGDYTFTDSTNNNTIKAKKIYATLNDVNPTKTYDGSKLIIDNAYDGNNKITQQIANSYVNVKGLMGNDAGNYTVTPTYTDKNVARVDGNVVNKGVNYEVGGINHNYQLYVGDAANNVLKGQGLINPKEITLNVTPVEKVYDGTDKTAIDISAANPTITTGVIDADTNLEETFILDKDLISGQYGNYDANGFEANGDVNYGTNYADSAGYKAVQYKGVNEALTKGNYSGTADVDNYVLVGTMSANNPGGYAYDATQGTITFSEEGAKGRITRRQLDNLKTKWESASKEYDAYTDIEKDDRDNTFKIYTDVLGNDPEKWIYVNYDLNSANYTDDSGNAKSDVGDHNMRYVLNGITAKDLQNFSMGDLENTFKNKTFDSKNGNATYNLDGSVTDQSKPVLGSITKRLISGKSEKQDRTYNGGTEADGSEKYFKIDPDDLDVLGRNGKDRSALNVVAVYSDKDSTLDVNGNRIDNNTVNVTYTLNWAEGQADTAYQSNYEFAAPHVGEGDIVQRKVYVVDNGGEVVEKTYNGGKELPSDVNPASRFALSALAGKESETGLVEGEDDIRLKTKNADDTDAITGKYVSPDVARDNGKVINTAVQYEGFELEDGNTSDGGKLRNYAIAVQPEDGQAKLTNSLDGNTTKVKYGTNDGKIVITEEKGGRINPKEINVNVINSPEKEYNRDIDVNGSKDGIKYASVKNLEVKIGDDVKEGGALSDTVRTISTGINNDKVTIALNGAEYKDKNVSYNDLGQVQSNKVSYFDLSWDNGNYKLVGESEDITGASGDTMTQGYDADNATFTGRLTDYTGTINPRLIDVTKVDKVVKTYDGDAAVESNPTFNITDADTSNPHFYIADDDKALLVDDKLNSHLAISGNYENKNANIYPKEYSKEAAEGGKKVNYNLVWNGGDEDARRNYKFADAGEYDITGTGDILRRAVNVTDNGGDVLTREYRGTKDTSLPKADLTNRFAEERNVSGTGIIDADVTLDKGAITGVYAPNGDVARDAEGNVINKAVTFSGFELQGTVDDTTGFNSKDNYYLTAQDGTVTLNGGVVSDVAHTIGKNGELLTITEDKGGRIDPKKIYISVEKSPTKVYDGDNLVKNDEKTGTAYASASNLKAAADGADVQRSFGNVNNVVSFTLAPGSGESESFDVTLEKATYDNTSTDPEKDNSMDVSRGANREVLKDKITSYNLSWTNGNYDLESEPASAEAGKQADTFAADGTNGYTDDSGKRTGVLKDYGGEITPKTISVTSMDTSKTYSGKEGYVVANPQVNAEIEGIIDKDMPGNGNVQDFLGLTVGKATYGAPTQAAIDEAQAENAPKNKKATADEIAEAKPWDAAFNRTADSFQHQVAYSGIAITNGNYELADDEFDGTGTINRAVVTAHPKSATIKAGEAMPSFKGTLDGFMDGETMPKTFYTTVENEDGTTTTTSETRQVPLSEYYNDPEFIYWGPEDGVTNRTEGTNPVYGWYLRKEVGEDKDGNEVVSYYKEKEANLDKNYTLVQAEEPSTLVVEPAPRSGGGGGSGSIVSPPVRESTPVYTTPSVPTPAAPQPQPVLEVGYVEKPVVADSSVYQNVSKDTSNSTNHEAQAAIQYGRKGAGIAAGNDDSGKSSTIAIELAEVVNLLGGDVASDGSMSLTNTDSGRKLSVGSTEEGYLSVGAERKEGSIGIETEGENILEEMAAKEGSIGIESEEAQAEVRTEDKEGQIELETEEEMLDAEGKKSSISLRSDGRDGESEITYSDGDLSILNSLNEDKKKEQKGEEDEEDSEKSESREGEAAIAYNDVA